jgi:PleD family two-component response regulator
MDKLPKNLLFIGIAENKYTKLSIVSKCLEPRGVNIDFIFQPEDTRGVLQAETYDVILLDFEINGVETFEILQDSISAKPRICVIILASEANKHYHSEAMKAGAYDFLVKENIDLQLLERAVNHSFLHSKTWLSIFRRCFIFRKFFRRILKFTRVLRSKNSVTRSRNGCKLKTCGQTFCTLTTKTGFWLRPIEP